MHTVHGAFLPIFIGTTIFMGNSQVSLFTMTTVKGVKTQTLRPPSGVSFRGILLGYPSAVSSWGILRYPSGTHSLVDSCFSRQQKYRTGPFLMNEWDYLLPLFEHFNLQMTQKFSNNPTLKQWGGFPMSTARKAQLVLTASALALF